MHMKIIMMKENPRPIKKQENSNSLPRMVQSNVVSFQKFTININFIKNNISVKIINSIMRAMFELAITQNVAADSFPFIQIGEC